MKITSGCLVLGKHVEADVLIDVPLLVAADLLAVRRGELVDKRDAPRVAEAVRRAAEAACASRGRAAALLNPDPRWARVP